MTTTSRPFAHALIILLGAVAILSVPLLNGYPLVYSDTGTYLRSAFTGFVPEDRPYWYGLFIKITSLNGTTLWGVIAAQSLLCSALLWRCWRVFGDGRAWTFLLTLFVLAPLTGLGWYAGQLVADIFSVIGVLAGSLFLLAPARIMERVGWALLMVLACWVHLSNLLILPLVFGSLFVLLKAMGRPVPLVRAMACALTLIAAWPGLMVANKTLDGEAYVSRYSHIFLMSRMAETGMLHRWLGEHCAEGGYAICAYTDSMPNTARKFMWGEHSPVHWQGGAAKVRDEYRAIINSTLTEPRYISLHIAASVQSTWQLLNLWRVADELEGDYYRQDYSAPYGSIAGLIPHELPAYLRSAQNTGPGTLGIRWIDRVYKVILAMALGACLVLLVHPRLRIAALPVSVIALATLVFGAWVCASLSTVDSRFMARTAWLLPMMVTMIGWKMGQGTAEGSPAGPLALPATTHQGPSDPLAE